MYRFEGTTENRIICERFRRKVINSLYTWTILKKSHQLKFTYDLNKSFRHTVNQVNHDIIHYYCYHYYNHHRLSKFGNICHWQSLATIYHSFFFHTHKIRTANRWDLKYVSLCDGISQKRYHPDDGTCMW